ncbi:MAG: hypothetical protein ACYC91_12520 [Solirubrobacteraceae bacterium]
MNPEHRPRPDLSRPRTISEVVATALMLYIRFPLLFLALALAVVVPYELVVLALTGAAPLGQQNISASTALILVLVDFAVIGPLISALDVNAVLALGDGARPSVAQIAKRGLNVLPVVAAAQIVAGLGIGLGFIAFVIPGIILALRWAVVAQAAAVERTDWIGALRRSGELTRGHLLHILGVLLVAGLIEVALDGIGQGLAGTGAKAGQVAIGIAVITITRSFGALISAILYLDLRARQATLDPGVRGL